MKFQDKAAQAFPIFVLDRKVKKREPYRPYAPAVVEEKAAEYFDLEGPSPVMIRVGRARRPPAGRDARGRDGTGADGLARGE
jgi:carbamoyltransferase